MEIIKTGTIEDVTELSILLNNTCNFSCSYCYSAQGRSNKSIDKQKLYAALSFFIDKKRTHSNSLKLVFSGGGDPLMSCTLLNEAIVFADELAKKQGITMQYGIVTNGSLLNEEFIGLVKQYSIHVVISFDVLEEVQNSQRGKYEEVCEGIRFLIHHDLFPGIRSTITPLNVCRMEEMVEEMLTRFPALGGIAFEPVLNRSLFSSPNELKTFYKTFVIQYFKSAKLGLENNLYVGNSTVNDSQINKERACINKFVITPEGEITACSRISSPKEEFYEHFLYGKISDSGKLLIDKNKRDNIMQKNVYYYPECTSCSAKWHCAGGCLLARYIYPPEYFQIHCDFIREMSANQ
jgi:radical SAM protein with 4Fe4S-binding SPASM domain